MLNSNQENLKMANEVIKNLRDVIRDLQNNKDKSMRTKIKLVNTANKLNFMLGYRHALREMLGFISDDEEKNMGEIINVQKEALDLQE